MWVGEAIVTPDQLWGSFGVGAVNSTATKIHGGGANSEGKQVMQIRPVLAKVMMLESSTTQEKGWFDDKNKINEGVSRTVQIFELMRESRTKIRCPMK